ncbi:CopG family ribbon-helix-helix protein [Thiocapsa bogorovii]|uniref:CopG family ribbon-helix-helix protein n=1 Tax=Thiocapsa bogorovii TaxID=521689 RepID=UPI001E3992E4|nr:ribbon-helix-helix protein, CopG family [Thiocapsa bogorovii]UHD15853.1 ribbon-helix-helix protein, CopG family [Thiocapsa bogorovii]
MAGSTITVRTDPEVVAQIGFLAQAMDRSRNWVIEEALKQYIQAQSWQLEGIKQAQASIDRGEGIPFDAVMEEMDALIEQTARARNA